MSLKRSADWRDRAAAELMSGVLRGARIRGNVLVMLENSPGVAASVTETGAQPRSWNRFAREGNSASAWVPAGPFDAATLRLPKAKEELEMAVHAAASVLVGGAPLWVYGANDEGAGSAGRIIEPVMGPARTVVTGGRCRVIGAVRAVDAPSPRGTLDQWRRSASLEFPDGPREWISYPGVFAAGRLDGGTRALLDALQTLPLAERRILDFACGSGVIGAFLSAFEPTTHVDFLDADTVALVAVSENAPGARLIASDGFDALSHERYNLIVSNPPYHEGKAQTGRVVERLVREAPHHLDDGGALALVTQRRLPLAALLEPVFETVEVLLDSGPHRVWLGRK
jgi:16S rRNA (guanine1207-N2)-methyltransferase